MSDDENRELKDKHDAQAMKRHNLTLKGADFIIPTNAAKGIADGSGNTDKEKKRNKDRAIYDRILREMLDDFNEQIERIEAAMEATGELKKLIIDGALDYADPAHLILIRQAGLTEDYVRENGLQGVEEWQEELEILRNETLDRKEQLQNLQDRYDGKPDDPALKKEMEELLITRSGRMQRGKSFDDGGEEFSFSNKPISVAKVIDPEGTVSNASSKAAFNKAASGEAPVKNELPAPAPVPAVIKPLM